MHKNELNPKSTKIDAFEQKIFKSKGSFHETIEQSKTAI